VARFYPARSWENPAATVDQFVTAVLRCKILFRASALIHLFITITFAVGIKREEFALYLTASAIRQMPFLRYCLASTN
jgi:hypothetical protein